MKKVKRLSVPKIKTRTERLIEEAMKENEMSKEVFIRKANGGYILKVCGEYGAEMVFTDLEEAQKEAKKILEE